MDRSSAKRLYAFIVSIGACVLLLGASALEGAQKPKQGQATALAPKVKHSAKNDTSGPLRLVRPGTAATSGPSRIAALNKGPVPKAPGVRGVDPVVQRQAGVSAPTPMLNFDGATAADNTPFYGFTVAPPDPVGDVGNGYFFQGVNSVFQIYATSTGSSVLGPLPLRAIFSGFGGFCEDFFPTDPIIRYDELAGRWLASWVSFDINVQDEFHMCIAVSTSADPTSSYNRYDFNFGNVPDYPKFGVWPDGYYMTINQFSLPGFSFVGIATWAFDRDAMLNGLPATAIGFDIGAVYPNMFSLLPSDLDGSAPPPVGAPNTQVTIGHPVWDGNPDPVFHIFDFHVDFGIPANSTLTQMPDLPVPDFNPDLCGFSRSCIPQLEGDGVDPIPGRPMNGLQYRNMETHQSWVVSQTVNVSPGGDEAGIRWSEIRMAGGAQQGAGGLSLFQSGTYAPTSTNRFMPSLAMDVNGNIALGYSISDATIHPEIGITGRLAGDPLGEMGAEDIMFAGAGSQLGTANRWGDYTSMTVDPADGCTFWYTNQYYDTNSSFNWRTRIGSFKFAGCTMGPSGTLQGTVTDGTNPIQGATVTADAASTTTDAAGGYTLSLPVGFYDMTASKYGFLPGAASGVEVIQDGTTVQDFVLAVAPSTTINGVVRDGSGGGWPLYARIQVSGSGYPGSAFWTDPVTGFYSVTLVEGITYNFVINAVTPGYETGGGPVDLTLVGNAPFVVRNWDLTIDSLACSAPGYTPDISGLYEDFSGGSIPAGWTVENFSGDGGLPWVVFEGADPCGQFSGNLTGGTGPYAIVNSNCDGFVTDNTNLITPSVDMSAATEPVLRFASDYFDCCGSTITADVSDDGGANWTNVFIKSGVSDRGPKTINIDLSAYAGEADVTARFHFDGFWAWWWQVDNVLLGEAGCLPGTGGLVVGNVYDTSTGNGLNGATVANLAGGDTKTFATPDPNQNDGFYVLYSEAGNNTLEASLALYASDTDSVLVVPAASQRLDFSLGSGNLSASPSPLDSRVNPGGTDEQTLTMTNTGSADASFELIEINAPLVTSLTRGFASQALRQAALARLPKNAKGVAENRQTSARDLPAMPNRPAPGRPLAVGDVISSFNSKLTYGWGVATVGSNIWLSDLGVAGGDNFDHEFTADGTQTGNTIDDSGIGEWAADGAFNSLTGNFWRVAVGGDNCIYEFSPSTLSQTGNTICGSPWTGTSQRGLAYSQADNTFFIGGWNEGIIYHIDTDGNVIDSSFVGLSIAGLAYNASNGHLLVMESIFGTDITVLDTLNNYEAIGSFDVLDDGVPVFDDGGQAGMEYDCLGRLWAINQYTQMVFQIESGEVGVGCEVDIPWFSVDPAEGTVPGTGGSRPNGVGNSMDVSANWDSTGLLPGVRQAQLVVKTDTPHQVPSIAVSLTVRFLDVPDSNQFEAFIYGAAGAGVMSGGPPNCPAGILYFCPDGVVTRADMAGYIFRAVNGSQTPPPVYQNIFADVFFNDYNSFYIQGIFDLGITAGCGNGDYCPDDPNTRAQMSVFIWKGEHGEDPPPSCTGVFADVACPGGFAVDYIEGLYNEGITAGCGGGNFCPDANITNGQMSVFLVKAFNIPYLQ